jgi:hypothetical protein
MVHLAVSPILPDRRPGSKPDAGQRRFLEDR